MKLLLTGLRRLEIIHNPTPPPRPADGYVSADVVCCAVCRTDAKMWDQGHRDLVFPRVPGHEMVVKNRVGERFVVWPGKSCGTCRFCRTGRENLCEEMKITGFHTDGGFADRVVLPEESLIAIPNMLDAHVACLAEPLGCVINAFEKIGPKKQEHLLIYGSGTMGLITAFYAQKLGLKPLIIEKSAAKIRHVAPFLQTIGVNGVKDTRHGEFPLVINACADFIALCRAIAKVDKGGRIAYFSGISKNEHVETNLLNLLHYKEATLSGTYGLTRDHMQKAVFFMQHHQEPLRLLIEEVVTPQTAPELMGTVLSGRRLKYILDFNREPASRTRRMSSSSRTTMNPAQTTQPPFGEPACAGLCRQVIRSIKPLSDRLLAQATAKIDAKTKPLGALGRLEDLAVQMCMIQNDLNPAIRSKHLFVFAGDHGVTEEGVSAYPSEVTAQMVDNFLNGGAAINVLCRHHCIDMKVVDMGVRAEFNSHPDLIMTKVAKGTRNFTVEDAMTRSQMFEAVENGMSVFQGAYENHPIDIVGLGEMGIGNTTCASAVIAVITGITPAAATGRGTGIDDKGLEQKTKVIQKALAFHDLDPHDGFQVLQKIGGFEIAGIVGAVLAAASKRTAVVLDGVISTAAGLLAYTINPHIRGYLIAGHKSVEKAQASALSYMGLDPLIDFNMRLGEGTGAALAIDAANTACKIMSQMASFEEAKVSASSIR